jgi:hypothetical protein
MGQAGYRGRISSIARQIHERFFWAINSKALFLVASWQRYWKLTLFVGA